MCVFKTKATWYNRISAILCGLTSFGCLYFVGTLQDNKARIEYNFKGKNWWIWKSTIWGINRIDYMFLLLIKTYYILETKPATKQSRYYLSDSLQIFLQEEQTIWNDLFMRRTWCTLFTAVPNPTLQKQISYRKSFEKNKTVLILKFK